MSDDVRLDTRIIRPDVPEPLPVVLFRTPYDELGDLNLFWIVRDNYVMVAQNTRGRFGSEGPNHAFYADGWGEHKDGLDTVNWILAQPWCDGQVCTWGYSASGVTQNLLAGADPAGLSAQYIEKSGANFLEGMAYTGGVFNESLVEQWVDHFAFPPSEVDIWSSHVPEDTAFWDDYRITTRQEHRDYPTVNLAGWYDCFLQGNIDNYTSIRQHGGPVARDHAKLVITLSAHGVNAGCLPFPNEGEAVPAEYGMQPMFDHYLKGIDNGFDELPRVAYYVIGDLADPDAPGNEWRYADDWPVPATSVPAYFHSDRSLDLVPPASGESPLSYDFDPTDPVPTLGGANLVPAQGNYDQRPVESRSDVLLFDSGPLKVPVELTGRLWVNLYVSSDCVDTDFTAKLTDVYPDGKSVLLCDGILRARYRDGLTDPKAMANGVVYFLPIDLTSTAVVFNKGHHIRVAISSSNYPRFSVNPNNGAQFLDGDSYLVAHNTIHMDAAHPSHIVLPLTGPDSDGDGIFDLLDSDPIPPDDTGGCFGGIALDTDSERLDDAFLLLALLALLLPHSRPNFTHTCRTP